MDQIDFARINDVTEQIIACAIEVHKNLGPGFLESVYEEALCIEFDLRGISYRRQMDFDLDYKGYFIKGQRLDLLVEDLVVVENKALGEVLPIHKMILISYLKAVKKRVGLIINYHERLLKDGIHRILLPEHYIMKD